MKSSQHKPDPGQMTLPFEELRFPEQKADRACETAALPIAAAPEYVSVYTVVLRRSDVLTLPQRPRITCPKEAAAVAWEYLKESDREQFLVLFLDTKNNLIGLNAATVGILDSTLVHPREVFKGAILASAASVVLAHNHPSSGDPAPSLEDQQVTRRLYDAGQIIGIEVMDHVIVGGKERWVSLKEKGLF